MRRAIHIGIVRLAAFLVVLACAPTTRIAKPYTPILDVAIPVSGTLELQGYLWRPNGPGPFPAVVLMHNCAGVGGTISPMENVALLLRDAGYVLLVVDSFSARQQSFVCDDPDNKKSPTFQERVKDAFAAKRYLSTLGFVDPRRIGLVGWSHGAIAAVMAWAENASVSDAPPYAAVAAYYPYCMTGEISTPTVPLFIMAGERDDWCPPSACERLQKTAKLAGSNDVTMKIYPGATHSFDNPFKGKALDLMGHHMAPDLAAGNDSREMLLAFFERTLKKT